MGGLCAAAKGDDGCSVAVGFFRAYAGDLLEAGEVLRGGGDDVLEDGVGEDDEGWLAGLCGFSFAPFAYASFEGLLFGSEGELLRFGGGLSQCLWICAESTRVRAVAA